MSPSYDPDLLDWAFWSREIRGLAPNTVRVRMDFVHRLNVFTGIPLREVTPEMLLRFERVAIAGRSPETRRAYTCHVRAFFRWAKQRGIIELDPTEVLTIPRVPRHLPRPVEEPDLTLALAAAKPKMRAMITLAAYAGLRTVEIAGLDWQDLRREPDGSAYLYIRHAKGDRDRTVEIGTVVIKALQAYGVQRRGPMFLGLDGHPIEAKSVSSAINRFLKELGVEATAHQLRHRYGTMLYSLSRDLRVVQEQLGHASPQTTAGYTRPSAEAAARAVKALDALATPTPRAAPTPDGAGSDLTTERTSA